MANRRYARSLFFLPLIQKNFSEMAFADGNPFDAGDDGKQVDQMLSDIQANGLLLSLLKRMDDRQKLILMFQLLREAGYDLNHADCAFVLNITRERYMVLLKEMKKRAGKILQIRAE